MYCFTADKQQDQLYLDDNTAHNILYYTILYYLFEIFGLSVIFFCM